MRKFVGALAAALAISPALLLAATKADVGPKADVAAVRAAEHRDIAIAARGADKMAPEVLIGSVHVSGNYALVQWYDSAGSGPAAFKKVSGTWKRIYIGGGAVTTPQLLEQHGIPAATARTLCTGWQPEGGAPVKLC